MSKLTIFLVIPPQLKMQIAFPRMISAGPIPSVSFKSEKPSYADYSPRTDLCEKRAGILYKRVEEQAIREEAKQLDARDEYTGSSKIDQMPYIDEEAYAQPPKDAERMPQKPKNPVLRHSRLVTSHVPSNGQVEQVGRN